MWGGGFRLREAWQALDIVPKACTHLDSATGSDARLRPLLKKTGFCLLLGL